MNFIPGPWEVVNLTDVFVAEESGVQIADCAVALGDLDFEQCRANAHLVAAAPRLLVALIKARHFINTQMQALGILADPRLLGELNSAIAKIQM